MSSLRKAQNNRLRESISNEYKYIMSILQVVQQVACRCTYIQTYIYVFNKT